jgi:hypothetical protein
MGREAVAYETNCAADPVSYLTWLAGGSAANPHHVLDDADEGVSILLSVVVTPFTWTRFDDAVFATEERAIVVDGAVPISLEMAADVARCVVCFPWAVKRNEPF